MRISMPRGDIKWQRFMVNTPNGTASDIDFTNIYFTVKENINDRDFLFQKSLQRGEIYKIAKGDYQFKITPADTNKLRYEEYKFDIQIQYKNLIKETFVGDFVLKGEVTFAENEDYEEIETETNIPRTSESTATIVTIPDYHLIQLETPIDIVTTTDYNDLANIPTLNGVKLSGHLSSDSIIITDGYEMVVRLSPKADNALELLKTENEEGFYVPKNKRLIFGSEGQFIYDGSQEVVVPSYSGEYD